MAAVEETSCANEELKGSVDTEMQLSHAMRGHKLVGANKHFYMACIIEKSRDALNKDVSSKVVWEHLATMYDMQTMDDLEEVAFVNNEIDFTLPEDEFGTLVQQKLKQKYSYPEKHVKDGGKQEVKQEVKKETPKSVKELSNKKNKEHKENITKKEPKGNKEIVKEKSIKMSLRSRTTHL